MGGPQPAPSPAGGGPADGGAPLILLAEPGTGIERALVRQWLREAGVRPSAVLPLDGPGLDRTLAASPPGTVITATRVAWLPPEREGERRVRWADVLPQVNPRRPPAFWQRAIMGRPAGPRW
jgi:glycerol-3-phosphate O-acyltransferase